MEIRNYTNFWNLERKFYSFQDIQLPVPVSVRVLLVFVFTGIPWWGLMFLLNVSLGSPWFLIWLVPPAGLAWVGGKPIFEGKTLFQYIRSRIVYIFENKNYKRLEPDLNVYETPIDIEQNVITKTPLQSTKF